MLLLLLQHEPDVRRALAVFLQQRGVMVETASSGAQAVNKAILIAPDVVVIDMEAPEAREAGERLKRTLVTRRIPIVALAQETGGTQESSGMDWDARLPRGGDPEELLAAVRRVRAGRRN